MILDILSGNLNYALFSRNKDYQTAGLPDGWFELYSAFQPDLKYLEPGTTPPTRLSNVNHVGTMEAVSVPFPATVPLPAGGTLAPKFFRIAVALR